MNKTYEFSQGIIRVVRVVVRDGHPSGKCARVDTDTVRLILEGDSAWIEGDRGRKKINVLPTQQGDTSLLKALSRSKSLVCLSPGRRGVVALAIIRRS